MKGEARPGMDQCRASHDMMAKKNLKSTRKVHPLFARGFDTQLRMEVQADGMRCGAARAAVSCCRAAVLQSSVCRLPLAYLPCRW